MDKKFKFASAIISGSLLITPISGLVNSYDNVAKAENKIIKKETKFSDYEFFKALKKALENGEIKISKEKLKEFEAQLMDKGYWGENKIVEFQDEAIDVYISGFVLSILVGYGSAKILGALIKYIPALNSYSDVLNSLSGGLLSGLTAMSNGVIIYFATYWGEKHIKNSPTGEYGYIKYYSHWRLQE